MHCSWHELAQITLTNTVLDSSAMKPKVLDRISFCLTRDGCFTYFCFHSFEKKIHMISAVLKNETSFCMKKAENYSKNHIFSDVKDACS